jgi:hypothetical protein
VPVLASLDKVFIVTYANNGPGNRTPDNATTKPIGNWTNASNI